MSRGINRNIHNNEYNRNINNNEYNRNINNNEYNRNINNNDAISRYEKEVLQLLIV